MVNVKSRIFPQHPTLQFKLKQQHFWSFKLEFQRHKILLIFLSTVFPHKVSGNYSFLNLEIQRSQYIRPKVTAHKCVETIQGRKLFNGGNYMRKYGNRNWITAIKTRKHQSDKLNQRISCIIFQIMAYDGSFLISIQAKKKPRLNISLMLLSPLPDIPHYCGQFPRKLFNLRVEKVKNFK